MIMANKLILVVILVVSILLAACGADAGDPPFSQSGTASGEWQDEFPIADCDLATVGSSDYFIMEPGFQLVLEGGNEKLAITVLDETFEIDGTQTRVVEEREWRNGELIEVSRNFFAFCEQTGDVYYFGEDVNMFSGGQLSSHSGAWQAGEQDARAGLIMPGAPVVGMKYFQEIAPGVAMDRAEIISVDEKFSTPAGEFEGVLLTREGTALNPLEKEFKQYTPGIGLIQDQKLVLTGYGFISNE